MTGQEENHTAAELTGYVIILVTRLITGSHPVKTNLCISRVVKTSCLSKQ